MHMKRTPCVCQTLRACRMLFRLRLLQGLQYRLAALSGASIGLFWAILEILVYTVFFTCGDPRVAQESGLSLPQAISYAWLTQMFVPLMPMAIDGDLREKIVSGDVGLELCRPLDLYAHWYARSAAARLGDTCLRGALVLLCALLAPVPYRLGAPASAAGLLLSLASLLCALLLCTAYAMLVTAVRVGLSWGDGPTYMLLLLGNVLSGSYLALQLWPAAWQDFLFLQPFAGYMDLPLRLYVGALPPAQAWRALGLQLFWVAAFVLLGRRVLAGRLRGIVIQGG